MYGVDAVMVDVRVERGPEHGRFTFPDADRLILDLDVHMDALTRVTTLGPGELEGYRAARSVTAIRQLPRGWPGTWGRGRETSGEVEWPRG